MDIRVVVSLSPFNLDKKLQCNGNFGNVPGNFPGSSSYRIGQSWPQTYFLLAFTLCQPWLHWSLIPTGQSSQRVRKK